jgi:hypothetical protein
MGSPFKTADDYVNATGTLHSFTGHPVTTGVTLVISVALTIYFLYVAYTVRH